MSIQAGEAVTSATCGGRSNLAFGSSDPLQGTSTTLTTAAMTIAQVVRRNVLPPPALARLLVVFTREGWQGVIKGQALGIY